MILLTLLSADPLVYIVGEQQFVRSWSRPSSWAEIRGAIGANHTAHRGPSRERRHVLLSFLGSPNVGFGRFLRLFVRVVTRVSPKSCFVGSILLISVCVDYLIGAETEGHQVLCCRDALQYVIGDPHCDISLD